MTTSRPRRAARRRVLLLALVAVLGLAPAIASPALAWTPPPKPLPIEPADTDGQPYELPDRPNHGSDAPQLEQAASKDGSIARGDSGVLGGRNLKEHAWPVYEALARIGWLQWLLGVLQSK